MGLGIGLGLGIGVGVGIGIGVGVGIGVGIGIGIGVGVGVGMGVGVGTGVGMGGNTLILKLLIVSTFDCPIIFPGGLVFIDIIALDVIKSIEIPIPNVVVDFQQSAVK